jgi:small subunit ribosomal protein S6
VPEKTDVNTNEYELVTLYRPSLEADLQPTLSKIAKIITDNGGAITAEDDWGRRALAYPINKETHALYRVYTLNLPADAPAKISQVLNITDEVLRYLLTKVDLKAKAALAEEKARKAARQSDKTDAEA